jgi:hypothetical protein
VESARWPYVTVRRDLPVTTVAGLIAYAEAQAWLDRSVVL